MIENEEIDGLTPEAQSIVPAIPVEEFEKILSGLNLLSISLNQVDARITGRRIVVQEAGSLAPGIEATASFKCLPQENGFLLVILQEILTSIEKDSKSILGIFLEYQLEYSSVHEVPESFFDAFRDGPLLLQIVPFAREMVQSITLKMGVPPITIPMIKLVGND